MILILKLVLVSNAPRMLRTIVRFGLVHVVSLISFVGTMVWRQVGHGHYLYYLPFICMMDTLGFQRVICNLTLFTMMMMMTTTMITILVGFTIHGMMKDECLVVLINLLTGFRTVNATSLVVRVDIFRFLLDQRIALCVRMEAMLIEQFGQMEQGNVIRCVRISRPSTRTTAQTHWTSIQKRRTARRPAYSHGICVRETVSAEPPTLSITAMNPV